jgi:hypothetical protein
MGIEHMNHTEMRLRGQEKCYYDDATRPENRAEAEKQKQTPGGLLSVTKIREHAAMLSPF